MGKLNKDNLRKTIYYLKKNGLKNTIYAMTERLQKKDTDSYTYMAPSEEELKEQRERLWKAPVTFSILVPVYHTPEKYMQELLESVKAQTYPFFQLILLDAGERAECREIIEKLVNDCKDERIQYYKLNENVGIAENTNVGLEYATGEYIALLDHDDLLTPDALYEMAKAIEAANEQGTELLMLYSDEDKCDGEVKYFYEPHFKKDFDKELLLTNNYICHFTAIKAEVFRELKLRGEYNGAQDFDLVLRVAEKCKENSKLVCHIPKVLYHWRCHDTSTAANPASKMYAYEAGKRAVEDCIEKRGLKAHVEHMKHLGFYRVVYEEDIFTQRPEIGAVGGSILDKHSKIIGGMQDVRGKVIYEGLRKGFSGYMNRAVLVQEAEVLDIRCMRINPACEGLVSGYLLEQASKPEKEIQELNQKVCAILREAGYTLVWDPEWTVKE